MDTSKRSHKDDVQGMRANYEVNILQDRACRTLQLGVFEHLRFSATKSFAQLTAKMCSGMNTLLQGLMEYLRSTKR